MPVTPIPPPTRPSRAQAYECAIDSAIALLEEDAFLEAWMLLKAAREKNGA